MPQDDKDLIAHLFATATAMLEDMTEVAVSGQGQIAAHGAISCAKALQEGLGAVTQLTGAIIVIAARTEAGCSTRSEVT